MSLDLESFLAALDHLPPLSRAAYLLRSVDDFSFQDIAFRLGLTADEAEWHAADALFLLNRRMREDTPPP